MKWRYRGNSGLYKGGVRWMSEERTEVKVKEFNKKIRRNI
jgi:hypothetical protein